MSLAVEPPPRSVTVRAPAKINLYLGVGRVRPDGFHPLATVYQAVGLYDDLTATLAEDWSVDVETDVVGDVPLGEDNIAVRAARALLAHHGIEAAFALHVRKAIPVAGGMAGGSADAAAALVAVDRVLDLQTSDDDLLAIAADLGSDVPFSLVGGTATGLGRGEEVEPLADAGPWWWVAVPHDEGLSTPAVYRAFDDHAPDAEPDPTLPHGLADALAACDVPALAALLGNDLQEPALGLRPDLRTTFADAEAAGARAVLLSGSGPTVLLLADDAEHARSLVAAMIEAGHPRAVAVTGPVAGAHVVEYDG